MPNNAVLNWWEEQLPCRRVKDGGPLNFRHARSPIDSARLLEAQTAGAGAADLASGESHLLPVEVHTV